MRKPGWLGAPVGQDLPRFSWDPSSHFLQATPPAAASRESRGGDSVPPPSGGWFAPFFSGSTVKPVDVWVLGAGTVPAPPRPSPAVLRVNVRETRRRWGLGGLQRAGQRDRNRR